MTSPAPTERTIPQNLIEAAETTKPSESELTRREILHKGASVIGWGGFFALSGVGLYQCVRFLYPSVVFRPPSVYEIGRIADFTAADSPDSYGVIVVDSRFKQDFRFYVIREKKRIYALFAKCTHLGCTVNWFPGLRTFKCPCHGSEFHSNGVQFAGPAPRPLDRLKIFQDADGRILVDTSKVVSAETFEKRQLFIEVT